MYEPRSGIHCRVRARSKSPPTTMSRCDMMQESRRTPSPAARAPGAAAGLTDVSCVQVPTVSGGFLDGQQDHQCRTKVETGA